jgi:hypothetical protein
MILRQDHPTLAGVSGICFLLDGINLTATGSFFRNHADEGVTSRPFPRCSMRLLFAAIHSHFDSSSGAALATREMLELLAGRGMDCRVLSAGVLDHERETSLDDVLATLELPARRFQAELARGGSAEVIDLSVNGVGVTLRSCPRTPSTCATFRP